MLLAALVAAGSALAQQALVCPPAATNQPCERFHYHVAMYRPDTKAFFEIQGTAEFASLAACERAKDAELKRNIAVVDYFRKKGDERYQADKFGPCHCDATTAAQKPVQRRNAEEVRWRVRERLLDSELTSDHELVRGLWADHPATPLLAGPKFVPLPQTPTMPPVVSPEEMRATKAIDTAKPVEANLELPLAEIADPVRQVEAGDGPAVDSFFTFEQDRIQNVLKASGSVTDDEAKGKIFEASMQRMSLLANLRQLIEAAGPRSRIAAAVRKAQSETDRIALVTRLFGEHVVPHWAPADPSQVVIESVGADPERVLRDTTGQFSDSQKRHALYAILSQGTPTDEQRLWLVNVVDALLVEEMPADETTKAFFFGKKFFDLGEYGSAYEQFAKADSLRPDQPAILYAMALALAKGGRYAEAQAKVDRYLQMFPGGEEKPLITKLHLELEFQRELQKKRQADQEYLELFNRGKFVYGRGELDEALKLFRQASQLRPADAAAIYNEAMVLEKQGDFANAVARYKKSAELEPDTATDQRVFALEHELEEMRTKIVCSFCGTKLPLGTTWCHRCWHGPYLVKQGIWNSRACAGGAKATRTTTFADGRVAKTEELPCLFEAASLLEALRYSPAKQRAVQDARKAEGWTYANGSLVAFRDQIQYAQGRDYLESVTAPQSGEILTYAAHDAGEGIWLLDREDLVIDAIHYTNTYTYAGNHIASQTAEYQNTAACNHLVSVKADYAYTNDQLVTVKLSGGYDGPAAEGTPSSKWAATIAYTYDPNDPAARLLKEELAVTSWVKIYQQRPHGALRDDVEKFYGGVRAKREIERIFVVGDVCATNGNTLLANPVDLRPFYVMSPNLSLVLPGSVNRAAVAFAPAGSR
jgi:tetratricopeptide (TPR) repeat protein